MRMPKEYPALVIVSNRKWDDANYLIESTEDLNLFALSFIKRGLENDGDYRYYKDVATESLAKKTPNVALTEAEVESLPEHLRAPVRKERETFAKEEKLFKVWLRLIEHMEKAVANDDPEKCWAIILKAKELGWHEEGDRIYLDSFVKYKGT